MKTLKVATTETKKGHLPHEAYVKLVSNPLIKHWSHIRCGSYTSEWIAKAIGLHPPEANKLLWGPVWFDIFRPVLPSDMRKLFKFRGMTSVEVRLAELSHKEKLDWIKREVAIKKIPPALLIRTKTLHWIAIGGYNDKKKIFYVYDARFGADSLNSKLPIGNNTFTYSELLDLWSGRWFLKYIAIVVTSVRK